MQSKYEIEKILALGETQDKIENKKEKGYVGFTF